MRISDLSSDVCSSDLQAAVAVISEGLLSLGLLKGTLKKALASESYKRFYMHKTGHWLGLDVHDVGDYRLAGAFRELEPGMVFTIEQIGRAWWRERVCTNV